MKYVLLFSMFMTFVCCRKILIDDELNLSRENYFGDEIKLTGYFFQQYFQMEDYVSIYFFYNNGIVMYAGSFKQAELADVEAKFQAEEWIESVRKIKSRWGVFLITEENIKFELLYPKPPLKAYVRAGKILNDSTFHILEVYRFVEGKKTDQKELNEYYHFHSYSPKPDSTNSYIP